VQDSASDGDDRQQIIEASTLSIQERKEEPYNYDDILEHIGQLGKYQLLISMLLLIPAFFPGIVVMSYSFVGGVPDYRCSVEQCANSTIPWLDTNFTKKDQCYRYNASVTDLDVLCQPIDAHADPQFLEACHHWMYSNSTFGSTIVSEFDLTCEDEWKQTLASTTYMFGMLFGGVLLGNLADIIGRRLSFTLNNFLLASVMTASAFSPDVVTFCVLRFFCGVAGVFHFNIIFVWGVEAVGSKYRTSIGSLYSVFFSLGSATLGLIGYFIRDWRTLQLAISIPIFIPTALYWVLPESTRWLITKKRYAKASQQIRTAASMNGKTVPEHLLIVPNDDDVNDSQISNPSQEVDSVSLSTQLEPKAKVAPDNIIGVICSPMLTIRLLIMFVAWIASIMSYYGISFSASNLSGNFFINYELSMVIEIPAYFFGIFAMTKFGRRFTLVASLLITGLSCLATGLVPTDPAIYEIVFSLIGKFCASISAACLYTFTSELFPTNSRAAIVGLCSTIGRIGSIMAPIVADLGREYGPALPFTIFAIINIIAGLICLLLPETNNTPLPSSIQEAKDLSKSALPCFRCKVNQEEN